LHYLTSARVALGVVWILEGLLPKLLFVAPAELELVARSGLVVVTPTFTLDLLVVGEMLRCTPHDRAATFGADKRQRPSLRKARWL